MKHLRAILFMCPTLLLLLAACAPQSTTPANTLPISSSTATLALSDQSALQMMVGSTYTYVDGEPLVAVPAGQFVMGHGGENDPQLTVNLDDFWIYQTKVTNQQYGLCVAASQCTPPDGKDAPGFGTAQSAVQPVVGITYDQATAYCGFVSGKLPTEAQWEKTARGPSGNRYPWGDTDPSSNLLNFNNAVGQTTPVFNYPAGKSYYDALDMAGNAFEWVADWYDPAYYSTAPSANPTGPSDGTLRSVRGSSFKSIPDQIASAWRFSQKPETHKPDLGFRCVIPDPQGLAPFCQMAALQFSSDNQPSALPPYQCPDPGFLWENAHCDPSNNKVAMNMVVAPAGSNVTAPGLDCSSSHPEATDANGTPWNGYWCIGAQNYTYNVTIVSSCTPPALPGPVGQPQCNPGYQYDPATLTCIFNGTASGSSCPAGFNFDSSKSCCTTQSAVDYPLCPAGQSYNDNSKTCSPIIQSVIPFTTTMKMYLPACDQKNGGGGGGCQPQSCDPGYSWDSQTCACVCPSGHC